MEIRTKELEWLFGDDTGTSSETIWKVMCGVDIGQERIYTYPFDPADFGRCYRLLKLFPEWRLRLHEVSERYPPWKPLIDNWGELEQLYEEEYPTGFAPKLNKRMLELRKKVTE